jgi:hypothetical protein
MRSAQLKFGSSAEGREENTKITTIKSMAEPQRLIKEFNLDMRGFYPKQVLVKLNRQ